MGYKIRETQKNKIPITIIIGDGEVNNQTISFRRYGEKTLSLLVIKNLLI